MEEFLLICRSQLKSLGINTCMIVPRIHSYLSLESTLTNVAKLLKNHSTIERPPRIVHTLGIGEPNAHAQRKSLRPALSGLHRCPRFKEMRVPNVDCPLRSGHQ